MADVLVECGYEISRNTALLVPRGAYDYFGNAGFMTLGTSRETSAFLCDAICLAWQKGNQAHYSEAPEIMPKSHGCS